MPARPKASRSRGQGKKGGRRLTLYLVQFAYTAAAWRAFVNQEKLRDRIEHLRKLIALFGGCFARVEIPCVDDDTPYLGRDDDECECPPRNGIIIHDKLVAFTPDSQVHTLIAFPSGVAANAFAIAVCQGGLVTNFRMTPMLAWSDAITAMARAKTASTKGAYPAGWS